MLELAEIMDIRQDDSGLHKRWFTSKSADLYIWVNGDTLQQFEYCFDKDRHERAIRWHIQHAASFARVDEGDHPGGYKMSPVELAGKKPNCKQVALKFRCSAGSLERGLRRAIYKRIRAQQ